MHVYVLLETTDVSPALLQAAPALAAAFTGLTGILIARVSEDNNVINFLLIG
jgi:hypothetical protein